MQTPSYTMQPFVDPMAIGAGQPSMTPHAIGGGDGSAAGGGDSEAGGGFFDTLLDILNPLQHIPIVSTLYRGITGDEVAPTARLVGGALFGGPLGFASALVNAVVEQDSGMDVAEHALALFDGEAAADASIYSAQAGPADAPAAALVGVAAGNPAPHAGRAAARERALAALDGGNALPAQARPAAAPVGPVAGQMVPPAPAAAPTAPATAPTGATTGAPTGATAAAEGPPEMPAWLGSALADARDRRTSVQAGGEPAKPEAQPWVAAAMGDALDKYEAMARQRAAGGSQPADTRP